MCDRVYEIKVGATGARGPKVFKSAGEDATTQGPDGLGSVYGPTHSRLFEALTDYRTAAGLDHPRANQELLLTILGIAHLRRIIFEVAQVGEHGLFAGG